MTKILAIPWPVVLAAATQVIEPLEVDGPAWMTAFLVGVFVVLWALNAMGRLPFQSMDRRAHPFGDTERQKFDQMYEIVTAEDNTKPRWRKVWASTKETLEVHALITELADLRVTWEAERKEWQVERARMEHRITELEDTIRRQNNVLSNPRGGA